MNFMFDSQTKSRTAKSLRNAQIALVFYCINLVLQFFSRKIFLDYLGSEVLGLNTTAQNLLGFLNLAELGIGSAVAYNLYKPLFAGDRQVINDIVSIQGWLYRRIACVVIAGSVVLMCFFPLIFAKAEVPLWYTYGSFIALLTSALLGYFVNYRQIVLSADQKEYKVTYCIQGTKLLKVLSQMVAILLLSQGYVWWMVLEMVFAVLTSALLDKVIKKEYSWLRPVLEQGKALQKQYPEIITKTKQVFFHRIGSFVLSQTTPLVIYGYASLTLVAIYGNYMLIVTGVMALMNALLNGMGAGIGNLVAEGDKWKIKSSFWQITVLRMWVASVVCFGIYMLGEIFIMLWVGKEYIMSYPAFLILIAITFIQLTRTNDAFLSAYGLFKDIWAPVAEALLNLGLSILLGYYWGLTGILSGVLFSLLVIVCGWKPYFLYRDGFKDRVSEYVGKSLKLVLLMLSACWLSKEIIDVLFNNSVSCYSGWVVYSLQVIGTYVLLSLLVLYITEVSVRDLSKRIYYFIIKKK